MAPSPRDPVDQVMSMMLLTIDIYQNMGAQVTPEKLDVIYAKCRVAVFGSPPTVASSSLASIAQVV